MSLKQTKFMIPKPKKQKYDEHEQHEPTLRNPWPNTSHFAAGKKYVEIHVLYTWKKDFVSDFDSHGYVSAVSVPCSGTGCHNSSLQNLNDMVGLGF